MKKCFTKADVDFLKSLVDDIRENNDEADYDVFGIIKDLENLTARVDEAITPTEGEGEAPPMTVVNPDEWEPCSPEYLSRGGSCNSPRVWNEATGNHYHPKLTAPQLNIDKALRAAATEGWNACASYMRGSMNSHADSIRNFSCVFNTNNTISIEGNHNRGQLALIRSLDTILQFTEPNGGIFEDEAFEVFKTGALGDDNV